jgi:glycosyltransferase involved in cell wall biosynthesis
MADPRRPIVPKSVAMFVFNEVSHDRRVLKEADALQAAGWSVTIHGMRQRRSTVALRESRASGVEIVRHPLTVRPEVPPSWAPAWNLALVPLFALQFAVTSLLVRLGIRAARQVRSAFALWAWGSAAARAAVDAEVLHAHDLSGGIPALLAADASNATIVYDSHEVFLESGHWARAPRLVRSLLASRVERPLLKRASGLITVNPAVEHELLERYTSPGHRTVVYNCVNPLSESERPSELRDAIGVGAETPVALYHGVFSAVRGLRQIITAVLDPRLADIHVVFLGYGQMEEELRILAARPEVAGRVHVLKAVSPEVLDRWVAGADVGLMPNQHETLNEYVSTPNKLFESIGVGTPVVSSDFPERRRIILEGPEGPLGALCNPADPTDIARAIVEVIGGSNEERAAYRSRCHAASAARWNWQAQVDTLQQFYRELGSSAGPAHPQVAMFVANNVVNDRRVIREAATVVAAGFEVTVHGVAQRREQIPLRERHPDGFTIVRHQLRLMPPLLPLRPKLLALLVHPFWVALAVTSVVAQRLRLPMATSADLAIRWTAWATLAARGASSAQILHAHDLSGALPALATLRANPGAVLLYDSHEVFLESGRWANSPAFIRRILANRFEQPALRRATALIAVNPQVIEELAKRYEIPERQVVTYNCPPAWNPEPRGTELRSTIGVGTDAQVILYHGGFSAHRGLEELLLAIRDPRLAAAHLVFLGYGPLEATLRAAAVEPALAGRVHVLKAVAPEVLDRWVSGADVGMCTVLPSTLNHRISTPNKLFESIGAGVPVVGSDFATMRDILLGDPDGSLGAVCDPTSPEEVATAIHSILSMSASDRAALRARCIRAAAARWNWEAQASRLTELYRSLPSA